MNPNRNRCGYVGAMWAALLLCYVPPGIAQVGPTQDGHALDSNPLLGSSGRNAAAYQFVPNQANLIITGNVAGGRAFQGFSPVRDPSQLMVGVPTSALGSFRRDSISVADVEAGRTFYQTSPFFLRETTVAGYGPSALYPSNSPGERLGGLPGAPTRVDYTVGGQDYYGNPASGQPLYERLSASSDYLSSAAGSAVSNDLIRSSPLFGLNPNAIPTVDPAAGPRGPSLPGAPTQPLASRDLVESPLSRLTNPPGLAQPLSLKIDLDVYAQQKQERQAALQGTPTAADFAAAVSSPYAGSTAQPAAGLAIRSGVEPREAAPSDTYRSMLTELDAINTNIDAALADRGGPEPGSRAGTPSGSSAESPVSGPSGWLGRPITSFVGHDPSRLNSYLAGAEELLAQGEFYRAAAKYEMASSVDPVNPLPKLGAGHALLGAGDYFSAVANLTAGIARFPDVYRFNLDLRSLIGVPDILDIRRADLEARLKKAEDFRLRFLLGYIEYYSGLEQFGIEDIKKAAAGAPHDSPISRFPDLLEAAKTQE